MSDTPTRLCGRCQELPAKLEGAGRLFLWCPLGHSFGKLVAFLRETGREYQVRPEAQCVVVWGAEGDLGRMAVSAVGALTQEETRGTRALFLAGEGEPGLADYPRVGSLSRPQAVPAEATPFFTG